MLDQFLTIELFYAALVAFGGGFLRGYSGFGSGMFMTPLLTLLWGPVEAIAVVVGTGMIGSTPQAISSIRIISVREMSPLLITALFFVPFGAVTLVTLDPVMVKRIIATAILFAALLQMSGWQYRGPRGLIPGSISGAISGWVNGVSSVGGPAAVIYLISLPDEPRIQRANIAITIYMHGLLTATTLFLVGRIGIITATWSALLVGPFLLGLFSGGRLFQVLPGEMFRWVVLTLLIGLSILILVA